MAMVVVHTYVYILYNYMCYSSSAFAAKLWATMWKFVQYNTSIHTYLATIPVHVLSVMANQKGWIVQDICIPM